MEDFMKKTQNMYGSLTKLQKKVADYIRANFGELAFITLDQVARQADVSTATVIRFAQAMGSTGYADMQRDIINAVRGNVGLPERLENMCKSQAPDDALTAWFEKEIGCVNKTVKEIDRSNLEQALEWIEAARNVYILGLRLCFGPAFILANSLGQVRRNVHLIQGVSSTYPENIINAGLGDVCMVIAYPRYLRETQALMREMKRYGVKIIFFTEPSYSKITQLADITLYTASAQVEPKGSFVSLLCLLDYIVAQIVQRTPEESMSIGTRIEKYLKENYLLDY